MGRPGARPAWWRGVVGGLLLLLGGLVCPLAGAWPTDGQWVPVYRGGAILQDANGDTNGARNIVSDATHAAAYLWNDGVSIFFRVRLDADPSGQGGQGLLQPFGWGVEFDTNQTAASFEWVIMVDGISKDETISLWQNTVQGTLGDPGDKPELLAASILLTGNFRVVQADTSFNGDRDYFLDYLFPYAVFKQKTGLTDSSPLRVFEGSSSSANTLSENGADLAGASDLLAGFSDYVTPLGPRPTTGTVKFVADLSGAGDVTLVSAGNPLFVRVDDGDQNTDATARNTVTVTLVAPSGDSVTATLTETGINTGVFTASVPTTAAVPVSGDGTLQVARGETVTVRYVDALDANLQANQLRTDQVEVLGAKLAITKTVTPGTVVAGGTVTYTITFGNSGTEAGNITQVQDFLPAGFSYVAGSTTGVTTTDPSVSGQTLAWAGNWAVAVGGNATLSFQARASSAGGTYYNNVTASGSNFVAATTGNTAPVQVGAPQITLAKTVSAATAAPGAELVYAIAYRNAGNGSAHTLLIADSIPPYTTYVAGSLRLGPAGGTYASATVKTDANDGDGATLEASDVVFTINLIAPNDGAADSGPDEGVVYFRVRVN